MPRARAAPPTARDRLTRERVFKAAIALADREGIDALTMRNLAARLGAGAMSLYYHVPNKDALRDGMVDLVFSEIELPGHYVDWKTALRTRAISTRAALRRHPWAIGLMESVAVPGPADLRLHNAVLGCLREAGFSVAMAVQAYSVQDAYIYGFALQDREMRYQTREQVADTVARRVRQAETTNADVALLYPHLAEVVAGFVAKDGFDLDKAFEFGFEVILDGLERFREASPAVGKRRRASHARRR